MEEKKDLLLVEFDNVRIEIVCDSDQLEDRIEKSLELCKELKKLAPEKLPKSPKPIPSDLRGKSDASEQKREGTINTLAGTLRPTSCREVLMTAAAHLALFDGAERFSRSEWIARAKEANVWKSDYSNQMATAIRRLVDAGRIIENAKDVFSLSPKVKLEIEANIDDSKGN